MSTHVAAIALLALASTGPAQTPLEPPAWAYGDATPSGGASHLVRGGQKREFEGVYSCWVPAWRGFALVDDDLHLAVLRPDGTTEVKLRRKLSPFWRESWAVSPDGRLVALADHSRWDRVVVLRVADGRELARLDRRRLARRGIAVEPATLTSRGVAWSPSSRLVAFSVARANSMDNGGVAYSDTVLFDLRSRRARALRGVAPVAFLSEGTLLAWTDRVAGLGNLLLVKRLGGATLARLYGVLAADFDGREVWVIRPNPKRGLDLLTWDWRRNSTRVVRNYPDMDPSSINENIAVAGAIGSGSGLGRGRGPQNRAEGARMSARHPL